MSARRFVTPAPRIARIAPLFASSALLFAAFAPTTAQAAPPDADRPAGAAAFVATTAENGTPTELEAVLDLREAGPEADVPRCLGPVSFARTGWVWVEPAPQPRRIVVTATAQDGSTAIPDLALFPQEPVTRSTADVREPAACDGRETLGAGAFAARAAATLDGARGDGSAAVVAVLRGGRPALVQVGWRDGDAHAPVVVTLAAQELARGPQPAGDDPATAPAIPLAPLPAATSAGLVPSQGAGPAEVGGGAALARGAAAVETDAPGAAAVALGGATLGIGDPAQPACQAPATVWRKVAVPAAGFYAISADGAARTLTAFTDPLGGDSALACADLADAPQLQLTPRVPAAGTLWLRLGADQLDGDANARLLVSGPYADPRAAEDAPTLGGRPPVGEGTRGGQLACVRARAPRLAFDTASLRALRSGRGRVLRGTLRQPCDRSRPRATHVTVALARKGKRPIPRSARGLARWTRRVPRRLARGRYLLVVRATVRMTRRGARGKRARSTTRTLATVRRTFTVANKPTPTRRAARR